MWGLFWIPTLVLNTGFETSWDRHRTRVPKQYKIIERIFLCSEYPCDHYTAIINVTLMNTGCPRSNIHETALQLLQGYEMNMMLMYELSISLTHGAPERFAFIIET